MTFSPFHLILTIWLLLLHNIIIFYIYKHAKSFTGKAEPSISNMQRAMAVLQHKLKPHKNRKNTRCKSATEEELSQMEFQELVIQEKDLPKEEREKLVSRTLVYNMMKRFHLALGHAKVRISKPLNEIIPVVTASLSGLYRYISDNKIPPHCIASADQTPLLKEYYSGKIILFADREQSFSYKTMSLERYTLMATILMSGYKLAPFLLLKANAISESNMVYLEDTPRYHAVVDTPHETPQNITENEKSTTKTVYKRRKKCANLQDPQDPDEQEAINMYQNYTNPTQPIINLGDARKGKVLWYTFAEQYFKKSIDHLYKRSEKNHVHGSKADTHTLRIPTFIAEETSEAVSLLQHRGLVLKPRKRERSEVDELIDSINEEFPSNIHTEEVPREDTIQTRQTVKRRKGNRKGKNQLSAAPSTSSSSVTSTNNSSNHVIDLPTQDTEQTESTVSQNTGPSLHLNDKCPHPFIPSCYNDNKNYLQGLETEKDQFNEKTFRELNSVFRKNFFKYMYVSLPKPNKIFQAFVDRHSTGSFVWETAVVYLKYCVIPYRVTHCAGERFLLIIDCFNGYDSSEFLQLCSKYQITVFIIPKGTTSFIQPCDITFNSVLKAKYKKYLNIHKNYVLSGRTGQTGTRQVPLTEDMLIEFATRAYYDVPRKAVLNSFKRAFVENTVSLLDEYESKNK